MVTSKYRMTTSASLSPSEYLKANGINNKCRPAFENWILQIGNYNAIRSVLINGGMTCPEAVEFLKKAKADIGLMDWKLEVVMVGKNKKLKESFYYPSPAAREKAMATDICDLYDRIRVLANVRMGFMHDHGGADPFNVLIQQAVIIYRWIYPFSKVPGAMLNRSLTNLSVNIIRDHFHHDDGFQKCDLSMADHIPHESNIEEEIDWKNFNRMPGSDSALKNIRNSDHAVDGASIDMLHYYRFGKYLAAPKRLKPLRKFEPRIVHVEKSDKGAPQGKGQIRSS